jgi:hypothetical protein
MSPLGQYDKDTTPAINPSHCAVSVEGEPLTHYFLSSASLCAGLILWQGFLRNGGRDAKRIHISLI